ncbi:MAG: type II secretion system F family protein [Nitriliruptorales bacterium]|nr:type II secretion system F family protein [Nitriliruptorales bacterium]
MPALIFFAVLCIVGAMPVLWISVAGSRRINEAATTQNLRRGLATTGTTDLRQVLLTKSAGERAVRPAMQRIAGLVRRLMPAGVVDALEHKIVLAGRPVQWPLERVLAGKLILGAAGLVFGFLSFSANPSPKSLLFAFAATGLGLFGPDLILSRRGRERQAQIERALPDTLDQITICVEAGLGFEAAMARAGGAGSGPLADEIVRTLQQMQLGSTRGQALRGLTERTEAPDLRRFVVALVQAEAYGLPIADVLRTQASELRKKRRQRAEEHAMKIPVKIIFPLVLCILPTLMIMVMGPAGIRMSKFFSGGLP